MRLRLDPGLLNQVWRHYATRPSGLHNTALAPRGTTRAEAVDMEWRVAVEAVT